MNKNSTAYKYLGNIVLNISDRKLKQEVFVGSQIHTFMQHYFEKLLFINVKNSWKSSEIVVVWFLGSYNVENYKEIIAIFLHKNLEVPSILWDYRWAFQQKLTKKIMKRSVKSPFCYPISWYHVFLLLKTYF